MPRNYYAVARGTRTGVYNSWDACKDQVLCVPNARYKKFDSQQEAEVFVRNNQSPPHISSLTESQSQKEDGLGKYYPVHAPRSTAPQPKRSSSQTLFKKIYVDGACRGNGKRSIAVPLAGYGVYYGPNNPKNAGVPLSDVDDVHANKSSNQRAELFAMDHALKDIEGFVHQSDYDGSKYMIYTDSQYAKNCMESWAGSWEKKNWKTSQGSKVLNQDIIIPAYRRYKKLLERDGELVKFTHVKGHLGNEGNEAADKLANLGADMMLISK
ncbi:hypothetical protein METBISCDRAFT_22105 [Metschnikowia bicuspidata]|uniref:Ribonuclease H n=1 Tax=Metschnikowia bicuspidata TaxID=27322 RepID=A0A4P9ZFL3_9ASCO|nr:hypothetical protein METBISCDRAFT_22105 [Metschnikowia bicuspidata]